MRCNWLFMARPALFASTLASVFGCGETDLARRHGEGDSGARSEGSFCERYDALSRKLGCRPLAEECEELSAACDGAAHAWLDCVERDTRQCICESDERELNCEGSFKPDEGPARCVAQYRALEECAGDE